MLVDVASREAYGQSRSEEIVKVRVEDVASGARLDEMIDGRISHPIAIAICSLQFAVCSLQDAVCRMLDTEFNTKLNPRKLTHAGEHLSSAFTCLAAFGSN